MYTELHERSKSLMTRAGVKLTWDARAVACRVMVQALRFHHAEVVDFCVGEIHWHGLVRFYPIDNETWRVIRLEGRSQNREPMHLMGIAKKEAARALSREKLAEPGGVFARGCGRKFIKNEWHYRRVGDEYIPDHAKQGAAVYSVLFGS